MWHGTVRAPAQRDPMAGQRTSGRAAVSQENVPDGVEMLGVVGGDQQRRYRPVNVADIVRVLRCRVADDVSIALCGDGNRSNTLYPTDHHR